MYILHLKFSLLNKEGEGDGASSDWDVFFILEWEL